MRDRIEEKKNSLGGDMGDGANVDVSTYFTHSLSLFIPDRPPSGVAERPPPPLQPHYPPPPANLCSNCMKLSPPPPETFILMRRMLVLKGLVWARGEKVARFFFSRYTRK